MMPHVQLIQNFQLSMLRLGVGNVLILGAEIRKTFTAHMFEKSVRGRIQVLMT